jgi:rhamnulokinase
MVTSSLVIDFGASNGRAMLCTISKNEYSIEEIHRFSNDPVRVNGIFYWDVLRLFHEIKSSIIKAKTITGSWPDSIGIDTWGASFALLDKDGDLLANPLHYRNECVEETSVEMEKIIDRKSIFMQLGYFPTTVFNAYHLYYLNKVKPDLIKNAKHFLNISDLFNYFLTGEIVSEKTSVAPSLLYNLKISNWDMDIIRKLGFEKKLFAHEMVEPATSVGNISKQICEELGIDKEIKVIAVAGHDTTSASAAVPVRKGIKRFGYISCGTWSVFGTQVDEIKPTKQMFDDGITFDEGILNTKHIRININGLWVLQECKRYWELKGSTYSFEELNQMAQDAQPFAYAINITDPMFFTAGNMPCKINKFLENSGQKNPITKGECCRTIIESLAFKYKECLLKIEQKLGYELEDIYMIGGGIQNRMLCQFTASALNRKVYAGPVEATVVGNLIAQGLAVGIIKDINEIRQLLINSSNVRIYEPRSADKWREYYNTVSDNPCGMF